MSKPIRYTEEFKREALKLLAEPGYTVSKVSRHLGVSESALKVGRSTPRASSRMPSALLRDLSLHVERPLPWALYFI